MKILLTLLLVFSFSYSSAQCWKTSLKEDLKNNKALSDAIKETPDLVDGYKLLEGSPNIRKNPENLKNLKEVLDGELYDEAGINVDDLASGINNSNSKAKMIESLKDASEEGGSVEDFLDAFESAGKSIDHKMDIPVNSLDDTFPGIDKNTTSSDLDTKWSNRQSADTKQSKIEASELLAESRVDQIYENKGWSRLDVDGQPPGKQGKFDRVYAEFDGDGDLVNLHVIEAKGGGSTLGSRTMADGTIGQQGSPEYKNDIIDNLLNKLTNGDPLKESLIDGRNDGLISYVLVRQKVNLKSNFDVKKFPD